MSGDLSIGLGDQHIITGGRFPVILHLFADEMQQIFSDQWKILQISSKTFEVNCGPLSEMRVVGNP